MTMHLLRAAVLLAGLGSMGIAADVPKPFPPGFLWGTAISGFQSDMGLGAPTDAGTDWWVWVRDPQNLAQNRVSGDLPETGPGFWNRYPKDISAARGGLRTNALRMGIEWSRIFPTSTAGVDVSGGITTEALLQLDAMADQDVVEHYRAVFMTMRARGLQRMVTLNHFSLPLWIHDPIAVRDAFASVDPFTGAVPPGLTKSGWLDPAIVPEFAKFAAYVGWKFGDLVDLWCTINEPVVILVSGFVNAPGLGGNFPPGIFNFAGIVQAIPQLVTAHARAYDALYLTDHIDADGDGVDLAVGVVHNMAAFAPQDPTRALDVTGAQHADYLFNRVFPTAIVTGAFDANLDGDTTDPGETRPDLAGRSDFLGVNYYLRAKAVGLASSVTPMVPLFDFLPTLAYRTPETPTAPLCPTVCTDFGWEIYPHGLREMLTFAGTLGVPIYITENGLADATDTKRAQYVYDHLSTLQGTIADGLADVRGYFHWSLTDNFEWASGYYPRFGLFAYDPLTGRRRRRPSAKVYKTIAKRNGIPQGLIKRYGP